MTGASSCSHASEFVMGAALWAGESRGSWFALEWTHELLRAHGVTGAEETKKEREKEERQVERKKGRNTLRKKHRKKERTK